jgi:hypothetical protein
MFFFPALGGVPDKRAENGLFGPAVRAAHHVFHYGKVLKKPDVLECPDYPVAGNLIWLKFYQRFTVEHNVAGGRPVKTGQTIENRGLASAVRPYQGRNRSFVYFKTQILDRCDTGKTHRQA